MAGRFDLSGRTAVVTGGLGILGRPICEALVRHGARVAVVDLDGPGAARRAAELSELGGTACFGCGCDVADPGAVSAMVEACADALGGIDILLNHAASKSRDAAAFFAPFEEYTLAQWRSIMAVNLDGMFLTAQAVGKQMLRQGRGGSMIFTSSIYSVLAPDDRIYEGSLYEGRPINTPAVYAASKAGVNGLATYLAVRWAKQGIRVNTLIPGGMQSGQNETFMAQYGARVPMGRMGRPAELEGAVLFLASDASSYVTGHQLFVDGGLQAW
ncbi:SDR family oxidoreductase [Paenibacillus sp. 1P07SE]|uniref:SDR family oxidoreductase n=1 Tax=Paenibacillus sp. 1P07SE TaxID=3132209 RepID=UPI0039A42902